MDQKKLKTTRRDFLKTTAIVGSGYWVTGSLHAEESSSANEKIQVACCGVNGKGSSDSRNAHRYGHVYAICDTDRNVLDLASNRFQTEFKYTDYREMLDQLGDKIDAVTVSTADHAHAVIAAKAMRMGKHVFCQKPLTHSIWEARQLGTIAREMDVMTQMGNQFTAFNPMREAAHQIRAGQIGAVRELHVWTNRPLWPSTKSRPECIPVPESLDWESWIGPAPYRDYGAGYQPFNWRGWWDFGTGALGDMACHTCNLPFMALNMRDPISVEAESSGHNRDSYPERAKIRYEFPEHDGRAAFTMYWYDGGNLPPAELFADVTLEIADNEGNKLKPSVSGTLFIGDRGKMYATGDYAETGIEIIGDVEPLKVEYPMVADGDPDALQSQEWFRAIRDGSHPPTSNFPDYAGPLTETILLGNLAVWKANEPGSTSHVEWDAKNLKPVGAPDLEKIVQREYRDGYVV